MELPKKVTYSAKYLALAILIVASVDVWSQSTCSDQLKLAQRRYDSGLLEEIPAILEPCMEKGFTREEKSNAYKILIQTYLFSDLPEKADEVMLRFLRDFPDYAIAPNDHREFINLHKTYRTTPIMKIEASLGLNYSLPWVKEYYGPENLNQITVDYSSYIGFNAEANYINKLFSNFDISAGVSITHMRIGYWNEPYQHTSIAATYTNWFAGAPIALRYNKRLLGLNFFAKGGIEPTFQLSSVIDYTRDVTTGSDPVAGTENVVNYQRRLDIKPVLSIGVEFKLLGGEFFVTSGIKMGTITSANADKRYSFQDFYNKYYFIPDDYWTHQAFFNMSYVFSIYNPKKILLK